VEWWTESTALIVALAWPVSSLESLCHLQSKAQSSDTQGPSLPGSHLYFQSPLLPLPALVPHSCITPQLLLFHRLARSSLLVCFPLLIAQYHRLSKLERKEAYLGSQFSHLTDHGGLLAASPVTA
jgi:hypothetical protein